MHWVHVLSFKIKFIGGSVLVIFFYPHLSCTGKPKIKLLYLFLHFSLIGSGCKMVASPCGKYPPGRSHIANPLRRSHDAKTGCQTAALASPMDITWVLCVWVLHFQLRLTPKVLRCYSWQLLQSKGETAKVVLASALQEVDINYKRGYIAHTWSDGGYWNWSF